MVVKYIKVTFVAIFTVIVGLITTTKIKADTIETVSGTFEIISEKQFNGDVNTPGIFEFLEENMIIGGPNNVTNITQILLNGQPLNNPNITYNDTFNTFGITASGLTITNLTINKSFISSNYGMANHVGDVWTIELSIDVMAKNIITGLPNEVWTNTGSGYYTFAYDNDYEYIYSNVNFIKLSSEYSGRFTKLRLADGVDDPSYYFIIDLEIYDISFSTIATDEYQLDMKNKNTSTVTYIITPVLYISVYDNNYHVSNWDDGYDEGFGDGYKEGASGSNEGYDDGYQDGVSTVYNDGFNGIINPDTNEPYDVTLSFPYGQGYGDGTTNGYDVGFIEAVNSVYYDGFGGFINPDTNQPYDVTVSFPYGQGFDKGYNEGIASQSDYSFTGILFQVFAGMGAILTIELLPGITLGAIVAVPVVFGIIYFILGKKGDD